MPVSKDKDKWQRSRATSHPRDKHLELLPRTTIRDNKGQSYSKVKEFTPSVDPMVITTAIASHLVSRIFLDEGSSINIMHANYF